MNVGFLGISPMIAAEERLRDYASAHRAMGCGCGACGQCEAMNLTLGDAEAIADSIDRVSRRLVEAEAALREIASLRLADHMGPHHLGLTAVSIAKEYFHE